MLPMSVSGYVKTATRKESGLSRANVERRGMRGRGMRGRGMKGRGIRGRGIRGRGMKGRGMRRAAFGGMASRVVWSVPVDATTQRGLRLREMWE